MKAARHVYAWLFYLNTGFFPFFRITLRVTFGVLKQTNMISKMLYAMFGRVVIVNLTLTKFNRDGLNAIRENAGCHKVYITRKDGCPGNFKITTADGPEFFMDLSKFITNK